MTMTETAPRRARSTYVKVLDNLADHPRWEDLDPEHVGLWVLALGYCSRNLTDGLVSVRRLTKLGGTEVVVAELVDAGRLHGPGHDCEDCPEVPEGKLYVHAYLEHQRSRDEVEAISAKRSEAGRLGGRNRHLAKQSAEQTPGNAKQTGSKSKPDTETETEKNTTAAAAAAEFESWWEMYPRKVGKAAAAKAYAKARREVGALELVDGLANATQVWKATETEGRFIPHPATWLNAGRWADEVALPGMPGAPAPIPVTLMQCNNPDPHDRHDRTDNARRYVCMGVEA